MTSGRCIYAFQEHLIGNVHNGPLQKKKNKTNYIEKERENNTKVNRHMNITHVVIQFVHYGYAKCILLYLQSFLRAQMYDMYWLMRCGIRIKCK